MNRKILSPWGKPLSLNACDGTLTIENANVSPESFIISCGISGRNSTNEGFDLINIPDVAKPKTKLQFCEIRRWGCFRGWEVFNAFDKSWDNLCLTQHQVVEFVKTYPGHIFLNGNGYTTFLIKVKDEYRVVYTRMQPFGVLIAQELLRKDLPIWNLDTMGMGIFIPA